MNLIKLITLVTIIFVNYFIPLNANAQNKLAKTFVDSTVNKLGELMCDFYIINEKGEAINKMLKSNLEKKKYYSLTGGELANILVEDMQSIANDKHLMLKFYPEGNATKYYLIQAENEKGDNVPSEISLKRSRFQNYGFKEVSILNGNVGYLKLDGFYDIRNSESTKAASAAMDFLSHTNGIIIDLSENTGGDPASLQFLISYFFNVDPATHYNTFHFRDGKDNYLEERTLPFVPGYRLTKIPLYVITSNTTFSAGEAMAYSLKYLNRAIIIGQTTGGGAHAADFKLINDYFDMSIPLARAINPITKTNWESIGVIPNIEIALDKAKDFAHSEIIKTSIKQETDDILLAKYKWKLDELELNINGFPYENISPEKYVGRFEGDRKIYLENGKLKYQRKEGKIATLTPINETSFIFDIYSNFRIRFNFENEILLGINLYLETGQYEPVKKLN